MVKRERGYMGFDGFSAEFADFLAELGICNTVEMLEEHRERYIRLISEPLGRLYEGLADAALYVSGSVCVKRAKCVSSMYNDRRFTAAPLKEYMYIRFREDNGAKDILGLYFDMGRELYSYGIRVYKQTGAGMERIRGDALARRSGYVKALAGLRGLGMSVYGDKYAKDRYPSENGLYKDLLNSRNFYIGRDAAVNENVFSGDMLSEIAGAYRGLKNIYQLIRGALYD
jgi:uncharacterized protein (DUF2461 family)